MHTALSRWNAFEQMAPTTTIPDIHRKCLDFVNEDILAFGAWRSRMSRLASACHGVLHVLRVIV